MELFKQNTKIDFMRLRRFAAVVSMCLFLGAVLGLLVNGLNWGLQFTGGTQVQVSYDHPAPTETIKDELEKANLTHFSVKTYGSINQVMISLGKQPQLSEHDNRSMQQVIKNKITHALPDANFKSINFIGASVSSQLANKGLLAVVVALLGTIIYIALRFEYRLALSAAVAMLHDPVLILGVFSWFQVPFDLTALAALLTVLGYSLNDTIVVFDRIRENFKRIRRSTPVEVVNKSINQTLSRTVMTSTLTLIVVVVLFFFGGPSIHAFSLALILGIIVGTYSSIYVAGAFAVMLGLNRKDLLGQNQREQQVEEAP